jgi:NAD(P)-dependent dehydrogenase (short-subunit alcohol dehydrogenase family)
MFDILVHKTTLHGYAQKIDTMLRSAFITGGSGGIGFGIAKAMLADGYRVTVTGVTDEEVERLPHVENLTAVKLDVTDDKRVIEVVGSVPDIDAVVNCAGMIARNGAEFTLDGFRRVLEVNLVGTMSVCLAARTKLAERKGCIVNLASIMATLGSPMVPAYSASKGVIVQLTKALAGAWAAEGIRVNALAPGFIRTELTRPIAEDAARYDGTINRTPQRRWGEPADVAGAAVFLCSNAANFITGTVLTVDGGYTAV